ncbi:MAG: PRD domain-containing protein, partial [Lachnospiraceae bacterium]|nr:PRD domain-containing protein [Lachnospiraceae bacterium]
MEGNYRILKILNNNAIVSRDADGQEVIIVGTGIGFHTRIGNKISPEKVSKQYILQGRENYRRFEALLKEIPFDCIEISEKIIEKAKQELKRDLNSNLIIALADHINFAVSQLKAGNRTPNLMLDEIQRFY